MMLLVLVEEFECLSTELNVAVRHGDEALIAKTDAEIQPLIKRIFEFCARDREDVNRQLQFFAQLAVQNCYDDESVRRYTDMMVALNDRYLGSSQAAFSVRREANSPLMPDGYDVSLHELLLDSFQDRIAVLDLDYRYIYTNQCNADFHAKSTSWFIGKHLTELIDVERFRNRAKPRLDQCLSGACVSYDYEGMDASGRMFEVSCTMRPFYGPYKTIAGVIVLLSMQPMFAGVG